MSARQRYFSSSSLAGFAVAACSLGLLTGCESLPVKGKTLSELTGLGGGIKVGQLPPVPAARQWPDVRQDVRDQRAQGYGLVQLPEMQAYLNALLAKIKQAAGVPQWPGAVYVTATSELDAYCTGAGNIYLSLAWLESMESEDEVVALLSHEFGHVYLNAHKLGAVVTAADQAAKWAAIALALAKKTGDATGWTAVDSLMLSYEAGKNTFAPAWGRGEEEDADKFGATLSLQLNYSFSKGFKAFLERQATWEAQNAERQEAEKIRLVAQLKKDVQDELRKQGAKAQGAPLPVQNFQIALSAGLIDATQGLGNGLKDIVRKIQRTHPDTEARLTSLTEQVLPLMEGKTRPAATVLPWQRARSQPRTATVLKNYQLAADAQMALQQQDFATARKLALSAAAGPTAQHALPVMLLSLTQGHANAAETRSRRPPARGSDPLERNLESEPDRAWRIYLMRANRLLDAGQTVQARAVMKDGFEYFNNSPNAWPDAIRFTGLTEGWPRAKQLAQTCSERFPAHSSLCLEAAASPADVVASKLRTDQKTQSLVDRVFKNAK